MTRRRRNLTPGPSPARSGEDAGREMLARIRQAVLDLEPDATVLLFGSRARGKARPGSDWDVLVLLDGPVDSTRSNVIHGRLRRLSPGADEVVQAVTLSRDVWNSPSWRVLPLHQNVDADGILLTADGHEAPVVSVEVMAEARDELIRRWLAEGREALDDAEYNAADRRWRTCVGRMYYACFHAIGALRVSRGYTPSSHNDVQYQLEHRFGETGAVSAGPVAHYKELHKQRLLADYGGGVFDEAQVRAWLTETRRLLVAVGGLLDTPPEA